MIGHLSRKQLDCFLKLKAKANIDKYQQYGRDTATQTTKIEQKHLCSYSL